MKCKNCGADMPENAKYCPKCGSATDEVTYEQTVMDDGFAKQSQSGFGNTENGNASSQNDFVFGNGGGTYCSHCGAHVDPWLNFCRNCGARVGGSSAYDEDDNYRPMRVGFVEAYKLYWKNYFNFNGRASLSEYWYVILWNILISFVLAIALIIITVGGGTAAQSEEGLGMGVLLFVIVVMLFAVANIIPDLTLTIRRLHDTGRSGFLIFLNLIPTIGTIILLILLIGESQPYRNQYN